METWDAIRARRNVRQPLRPLTGPDRRLFGEVVHWGCWWRTGHGR